MLRALKRISYFVLSFGLVCCLGFLLPFVWDIRQSPVFIPQLASLEHIDYLKIEEFFVGDKAVLELSDEELNAYIDQTYLLNLDFKNGMAETLSFPHIDISEDEISFSVSFLLPMLRSSRPVALSFCGELKNKKFKLKTANIGDAKIPNFIAEFYLKKTLESYQKMPSIRKYSQRLKPLSDIRVESGKLILAK